jgi:hypothetical protein
VVDGGSQFFVVAGGGSQFVVVEGGREVLCVRVEPPVCDP